MRCCFKQGIMGFLLAAVSHMYPLSSELDPPAWVTVKMHQCNEIGSNNCFPSFFHTGQLQFLQHQMQQQPMAMGTAAPQVGAPQPHTASQPRSKRKRSMPQPLPKSWEAQTHEDMNDYTVLFICLTVETRTLSLLCLFLADIFVCNVCQRSLKNQNCFWP